MITLTPEIIHYSDWAGQPDVRIACDQSYGTPAWGPDSIIRNETYDEETGKYTPGIYLRDDGKIYTFEVGSSTCHNCLALYAKGLRGKLRRIFMKYAWPVLSFIVTTGLYYMFVFGPPELFSGSRERLIK